MAAPLRGDERLAIALLEAELKNLARRVDGHHMTLYGTQGNGGLQNEVSTANTLLQQHIRDEAMLSDRNSTLLVGEDGDAGVIAELRDLRRDMKAVKALAKALGGAILLLVVEAGRRALAWVAGR